MKNILDRFWTICLDFFLKNVQIFPSGRLRARAVHGVSSLVEDKLHLTYTVELKFGSPR